VCISWERTGGLRACWRVLQGVKSLCLLELLAVYIAAGTRVLGFTSARVAWSRVSGALARAAKNRWTKCNHDDAWKVL
jgi:hypothetical protein